MCNGQLWIPAYENINVAVKGLDTATAACCSHKILLY